MVQPNNHMKQTVSTEYMSCGCSESYHYLRLWDWDCCGTKLVSSPGPMCTDLSRCRTLCLGSRYDMRHREYPAMQSQSINTLYFTWHIQTDMCVYACFVSLYRYKCHWL